MDWDFSPPPIHPKVKKQEQQKRVGERAEHFYSCFLERDLVVFFFWSCETSNEMSDIESGQMMDFVHELLIQ